MPLDLHAAGNLGKAEIAFSQGLLAYHDQKYAEASQFFSQAVKLDSSHQPAAYFLGMSEFQQENNAEAIEAFDKAIALKPQDAEPYFYRGLALYRLEKKTEAKSDFSKAVTMAPPGPIRDLSKSYLRRINFGNALERGSHEKTKPWFTYGSFSTRYDSNVSLNPENVTIASLPTSTADAQLSTRVGGGYHLIDHRQYRLTSEASYYQSIYPDHTGFNYGLVHAEINNQFRRDALSVRAPLAYEFSLLGTSKYLSSALLAPGVSYLIGNKFLTQFTPEIRYNSFFQTLAAAAQNRDAWNFQLEVAESIFLIDQQHFARVSYTYENNFAKGNDWDYQAHSIGAMLYLPLLYEVNMQLRGQWTVDKSFANIDSILGTKRSDFGQNYGATFSRKITPHLEGSLHYDFYRNTSNQAFFQYNRHLAGGTLVVRY